MDPFFSVIIASLNNVEALTNCINSINKQTFNSYEVIVSDGGSNDGSILLLQPNIIRNLKWHKSCKDNGIYDALNIGISKANGQWLLVLGSDDLLSDENALLRAYNIILLDVTTPHFYYSDIFIKNKKKIKIKKYSPINIFNREYAGGPFFHHQSVFFKRSSIIELGYFDITYKIHADYFLLLKAHLIIPAKKINSSFVIYDSSGFSSKTRNIINSFTEILLIRQRLGVKPFSLRIVAIFLKIVIFKVLNIRN